MVSKINDIKDIGYARNKESDKILLIKVYISKCKISPL